jgi:hypothetical protein
LRWFVPIGDETRKPANAVELCQRHGSHQSALHSLGPSGIATAGYQMRSRHRRSDQSRFSKAMAMLDEATACLEASDELYLMPELLRVRGEALARTRPSALFLPQSTRRVGRAA